MLNKKEQEKALQLARDALKAYPDEKKLKALEKSGTLMGKASVFVSIYIGGELHGCIGNLNPDNLNKQIVNNAVLAGFHDTRFESLPKDTVEKADIEISVFDEPKPLDYYDSEDLLLKLTKKEGVVIEYGFYKATFLPQVWEQLPEKEEFLSHLCMKAGLKPDAWKTKKLKVSTYKAQVFRSAGT